MYARVLGDAWSALDLVIRAFHEPAATSRRASGVFRVSGGTHPLSRLIARLAKMPPPADAVPVRLVVIVQPASEEWRRMFGDWPLVSRQTTDGDVVVERFGPVEVRFRLEVIDGALRYRLVGSRLRVGPLAFPLPLRASASERARGASTIDVAVAVSAPMLGRLVAYEGTLTHIEVER